VGVKELGFCIGWISQGRGVQIGCQARGGVLIGVLYDRINGRAPDRRWLL